MATDCSTTRLQWNGFHARTGKPAYAPSSLEALAELARRRPFADDSLRGARLEVHKRMLEKLLAPRDGIDPLKLHESGWGIVFAKDCPIEIREALAPVIEWREAQATRVSRHRFAELTYEPGDTRASFLNAYGADLDAADPKDVPYYLLFVGGPEEIPYEFQYQLDIEYAVGRLDFDRAEDYAAYAQAVVEREKAQAAGEGRASQRCGFFAPRGDWVTERIHDELVKPMLRRFSDRRVPGWDVTTALAEAATKDRLHELLAGPERAAFLFTGCHGLVYDPGDAGQREGQGALVTHAQDWFAAADLDPAVRLDGLVSFHFTCHSAGTPQWDDFEESADGRKPCAPRPFTARLPQRLLAQGAGAVLAHVGRAWTYSFSGQGGGTQIDAFEDTIRRVLSGCPVGFAAEIFNHRSATLSTDLMTVLDLDSQRRDSGASASADRDLASLYCAVKDARNFVVLGDPAVRLPTGLPRGRQG